MPSPRRAAGMANVGPLDGAVTPPGPAAGAAGLPDGVTLTQLVLTQPCPSLFRDDRGAEPAAGTGNKLHDRSRVGAERDLTVRLVTSPRLGVDV